MKLLQYLWKDLEWLDLDRRFENSEKLKIQAKKINHEEGRQEDRISSYKNQIKL